MTVLSYERCCAEIIAQTDLLRSCIDRADLTVPVPSASGTGSTAMSLWTPSTSGWLERVSFG
jgi:hypothetical protein